MLVETVKISDTVQMCIILEDMVMVADRVEDDKWEVGVRNCTTDEEENATWTDAQFTAVMAKALGIV